MGPSGAASLSLSKVLEAVARANVFPDSKTIVDMPLRAPPEVIQTAFDAITLPDSTMDPSGYTTALKTFVEQWFDPIESDLIAPYSQKDSLAPPPLEWLPLVKDPLVRCWAVELHNTWATLCRAAAPCVALNTSLHTLLPVSGIFIMPGARFREGYYWDSYWAVQGLIISGLLDMARDVVSNLISCVEEHGFVPNGLRSYYLNRSQPPLLAAMVEAVWKATKDREFLLKGVEAVDKELRWWREYPRTLQCCSTAPSDQKQYLISRYYAAWEQPRPESYKEDIATVSKALSLEDSASKSAELYRHIASAAESGWDFSSRWFRDGKTLSTIRTTEIGPADLNALLYKAECICANLAIELGDGDVAKYWKSWSEQRLDAINTLHWDAENHRWRDIVLNTTAKAVSLGFASATTNAMYASDFIPLWCGCAAPQSDQAISAVSALASSPLLGQGGIAASSIETGEQWDWPNVWPPLQSMLAEGCERYGGQQGEELAEQIAHMYLNTTYTGWKATGRMYEKFDAREVGAKGGGGEYACMDGFGWTNGLALVWLSKYGWKE